MTVTINDQFVVTDSYGRISPDGVENELGNGAPPGWYSAWTTTGPEIGMLYDLSISPALLALSAKDQCKNGGFADYGFKNQGRCIASLQGNRLRQEITRTPTRRALTFRGQGRSGSL